MPERSTTLPDDLRADVQTLWDYHDMHHELRPADVGIGLGSHDLGVATFTAELFQAGMFPLIVFTGANAPTTVERFPRGEAVHYREHALELGVPDDAILVEPEARNTGDNITLTRKLLESRGIEVGSVVLISRPYQQRRAYATCKKLWPDVDVICASRPLPLDEYIESIGDVDRVINMLVGDTSASLSTPNAASPSTKKSQLTLPMPTIVLPMRASLHVCYEVPQSANIGPAIKQLLFLQQFRSKNVLILIAPLELLKGCHKLSRVYSSRVRHSHQFHTLLARFR